jgi:uncharacterized protein (TIGR03083 family)
MALLERLSPEDWARPTACALWSVRDIVAHLLDVDLRRLSFQRDGALPRPDMPVDTPEGLIAYLDRLNADWVRAARRLSPRVLVELHRYAGPRVAELFQSLDPEAPALFSVAWAGDEVSPNWFDIGREYTERWLHQAQIRDAVGAPGLNGREWLHPVLDLFLRSLPHAYRRVEVSDGLALGVEISGDAGGSWSLVRNAGGWRLYRGKVPAAARVALDQDTTWRLFSKGISGEVARQRAVTEGDPALTSPFFGVLAVMASPAAPTARTV